MTEKVNNNKNDKNKGISSEKLSIDLQRFLSEVKELPLNEREKFVYLMENTIRDVYVSKNIQIDGFVYKTKDLTQFSNILGNRLINEHSPRVKELSASIKRIGNIVPMIINEKKEIIDGQRRILAVRSAGLPEEMKFLRIEGANIDTVTELNENKEGWLHTDWLNKYVKLNYPDYIEYSKMAKEYEPYMKSRSLKGLMMNGRVDPLKTSIFKDGLFTIDKENREYRLHFLDFLKRVYLIGGKDNIFARDRSFHKALWDIFTKTKNLDEDRLIYKIQYGFMDLNIKTDFKKYKEILGRLYNLRLVGDRHHIVTADAEVEAKEDVQAQSQQPISDGILFKEEDVTSSNTSPVPQK